MTSAQSWPESSEADGPPDAVEVASSGQRTWTQHLGYPKPLPYDPTEVLCDRCQKFNWRYHFLRLDPELRAGDPMIEELDAIVHNALNARQDFDFAIRDRPDPLNYASSDFVEIPNFHAGGSYYMTEDEDFAFFILGSWGSVVQSAHQCDACRLIQKSFSGAEFDDQHPVSCWSVKHEFDDVFGLDDDLSPIIFEVYHKSEPSSKAKIPLGRFSIIWDKFTLFSRPTVSPLKFDPQCAKMWLNKCRQDHRGICRQSLENKAMDIGKTIIRVFDVHSRRVVIAPPGCDYITLSYVWGNAAQFQLRSEDIDQNSNSAPVEPTDCSKCKMPSKLPGNLVKGIYG